MSTAMGKESYNYHIGLFGKPFGTFSYIIFYLVKSLLRSLSTTNQVIFENIKLGKVSQTKED